MELTADPGGAPASDSSKRTVPRDFATRYRRRRSGAPAAACGVSHPRRDRGAAAAKRNLRRPTRFSAVHPPEPDRSAHRLERGDGRLRRTPCDERSAHPELRKLAPEVITELWRHRSVVASLANRYAQIVLPGC